MLLGGSGGGLMALMMAGRCPARWMAVGAWCPITDLARWYQETESYRPHMRACCGGAPGDAVQIDHAYRNRSPLYRADAIAKARLAVYHGRRDPLVPYTHTVRLGAALEAAGARECYVSLFDGGHEVRCEQALAWFESLLDGSAGTTLTG